MYLEALALDPQHPNANLQLARMSVEDKRGRAALGYLSHLGDKDGGNPVVLELRARALSLAGQCSDAAEVVKQLEGQPAGDWRIHFSAGAVYAGCKFYDQAEASFSRALDADPRNFDILYNLGLAALNAGHFDRAASVFETALNERPEEVDCLYQLSHAYLRQERKSRRRRPAGQGRGSWRLAAQTFCCSWRRFPRSSNSTRTPRQPTTATSD